MTPSSMACWIPTSWSSHGNNMRVDSFVYTREGLQDAFDHLKPGGLMSVAFALPSQIMGEKVFQILHAMPGAGAPVAVLTGYDSNNTTTFMVRKGAEVASAGGIPEAPWAHAISPPAISQRNRPSWICPATTGPSSIWRRRCIRETYLMLLGLVLVIAYLMVRGLLPAASWQPSLLPYFFLGGGFMLVETKAITELGLLLGNTWQVVGITISQRAGDGVPGQSLRRPAYARVDVLGLCGSVPGFAGRLCPRRAWQRVGDIIA